MDDLQFLYLLITLRSMHVSYSYKVCTDALTQQDRDKEQIKKGTDHSFIFLILKSLQPNVAHPRSNT